LKPTGKYSYSGVIGTSPLVPRNGKVDVAALAEIEERRRMNQHQVGAERRQGNSIRSHLGTRLLIELGSSVAAQTITLSWCSVGVGTDIRHSLEEHRQIVDRAMIQSDLSLPQEPRIGFRPPVLAASDDEPLLGEAAASEYDEIGPDVDDSIGVVSAWMFDTNRRVRVGGISTQARPVSSLLTRRSRLCFVSSNNGNRCDSSSASCFLDTSRAPEPSNEGPAP
jgi:hypothetical protein